jgi:glycosyltransferase involved in cell wall biosynthesis
MLQAYSSSESTPWPLAIVICTYNRCELLRSAIESLINQDEDAFSSIQLIIVDSSSSDNTVKMVRSYKHKHNNISLEITAKLGLPRARNDALAVCQAPYIGYFDDDAKAPCHWISQALGIIRDKKPVAFGGPFYPFYLDQKPKWFRDEWGSVTYGNQPRWLDKNEFLNGGNMFFNSMALRTVDGFDSGFVDGTETHFYGEEAGPQIALRAKFSDAAIYMDPELFIYHLVRGNRLSLVGLAREHFEYGRGYGKLIAKSKTETRSLPFTRRMWQQFALATLKVPLGVFRSRTEFPHIQHYWVERVFAHHLKAAGLFCEQARVANRTSRETF